MLYALFAIGFRFLWVMDPFENLMKERSLPPNCKEHSANSLRGSQSS